MGGGFSWQAVGMGALTGAIGAGFGYELGAAGTVISSGVSNWLQNAVQGHAGFHSFAQGLELGAIIAVAQIGLSYLIQPGEQEATNSGANRAPAGFEGADPYPELPEPFENTEQGAEDAAQVFVPAAAEAGAALVSAPALIEGGAALYPGAAYIYSLDPDSWNDFFAGLLMGVTGEDDGTYSNWTNLSGQFSGSGGCRVPGGDVCQ